MDVQDFTIEIIMIPSCLERLLCRDLPFAGQYNLLERITETVPIFKKGKYRLYLPPWKLEKIKALTSIPHFRPHDLCKQKSFADSVNKRSVINEL